MIASKLREARERAGLSLEQVEHRTGIDNSNLHKYESGKVFPSDTTLNLLSALYGIPFPQLKAWKIIAKLRPEELEALRNELI